MLNLVKTLTEALSHYIEFRSYKADIYIILANEAKDDVLYRFC